MGMWNLRGRTGRCAPWILTLAILASSGQGFALVIYVITALAFIPSAEAGETQNALVIAVAVIATLLGCVLVWLTWVATLGRRRAVIGASIAGLVVAVAFPVVVSRSVSLLTPAPTSEYEVGFAEVLVLLPLPGAFVASAASFVGFLIALAVAAWARSRGESRQAETSATPSPAVTAVSAGTAFMPLPLPGEEPLP